MFAFGASSMVPAVGGVNSMSGLTGVFTGGVNLKTELSGTSVFNNVSPGHSGEFVHSYVDTKGYWEKLNEDIEQ
jgi:hypothetical protein